jgi:hypothetical protein
MKTSLGLERTFWLGDYKSLKVVGYMSNIPQDIALNPEAMSMLRKMQMNRIDLAYLDYVKNSLATKLERLLGADTEVKTFEDALGELINKVEKNDKEATRNLMEAFISDMKEIEADIAVKEAVNETEEKDNATTS